MLKDAVHHQAVGEIDGGVEHDRRDERSRQQIQAHEDGARDTGSDDAANALEGVAKAERDNRHDNGAAAQSQRLQVPQDVAAGENFFTDPGGERDPC